MGVFKHEQIDQESRDLRGQETQRRKLAEVTERKFRKEKWRKKEKPSRKIGLCTQSKKNIEHIEHEMPMGQVIIE